MKVPDLDWYQKFTSEHGEVFPTSPGLWFYQIVRRDGSWEGYKCGAEMVTLDPCNGNLLMTHPLSKELLTFPRDCRKIRDPESVFQWLKLLASPE